MRELFCGIGTGIGTNNDVVAMALYPNPCVNMLTVERRSEFPAPYEVNDAMGRLLLSGTLQNDKHPIDVGALPKGLYLLRAMVDGKAVVERFAVER